MTSKKSILALVLVNLVILLLIEAGFRIFGLGNEISFLLQETIGDVEYLRINPDYARKYTTRINALVPEPLPYTFQKKKPDKTYRIYVLENPPARGFLTLKPERFRFQLEQMLNKAGAEQRFEVINMSMPAISSRVGVDIARQAAACLPDLVIVYFGHNEFIGIGGGGSWNSLAFRRTCGCHTRGPTDLQGATVEISRKRLSHLAGKADAAASGNPVSKRSISSRDGAICPQLRDDRPDISRTEGASHPLRRGKKFEGFASFSTR